jgi:hypothetical protein
MLYSKFIFAIRNALKLVYGNLVVKHFPWDKALTPTPKGGRVYRGQGRGV